MSERGFLVCADITGYTRYLGHSELEHASAMLSDLLKLLLSEVRAPLRLSRVEGDAVISYAPGGDWRGQIVVDRIDHTYVAFRRAMEQMILNTTCRCNACANIAELDLKFIVHHGEFAIQRIGSQDELVGSEVNLLFRLAKNRINQALGMPGYIAFTPEALEALALPGFAATLAPHVEDDPERGKVTLGVKDLRPVWESGRHARAVKIAADEFFAKREHLVAAPREDVFVLLTDPAKRTAFFEADRMEVDRLPDGRIGTDTVYVCYHGNKVVRQVILDWLPPEHYAFSTPIPGGVTLLGTFDLEEVGTGTRVVLTLGLPRSFRSVLMRPILRRGMEKWLDSGFSALDEMAAALTST